MKRLAASLILAVAALACAAAAPAWRWALPPGVAPPMVPADNPMSEAKVELGRRLFYDADLSVDGTLSCAACHEQHRAFAEGNRTHPGVGGALGRRNVPGLANVAYLAPLTWADPGETSLEVQVATPITGQHPVEMGMHGQEGEIAVRLGADACYRAMFAAAFPERKGEIDFETTAKALAAFQRTLLSFDTPYDHDALDGEAQRGAATFRAEGCAACHSGKTFTDGRFHVIGPQRGDDAGAFEKTFDPAHRAAFRTPSLRNVELTGPYLHDGVAATIRQAIFAHQGTSLGDGELADIEAFLRALTDRRFVSNPAFALPRSFCGKAR